MYVCEDCGKSFTVKGTFKENESVRCIGCKRKETYRLHPELSAKRVQTYKANSMKKYGVDDPNKTPQIREKVRGKLNEAFAERKEEILEKRISTTQERYGVDHVMQDANLKQKCFDSQIQNGGIGFQREHLQKAAQIKAHSPEAYESRHSTCMEKYGVEHHFQNKNVLDKQWDSYKEKTGYDHPAYNPEIIHSAKGYLYNEVHFDSSWELAYYIWLVDNKKQFIYHPPFPLEYFDDNNEKHTYYPDFLIEGKFVEIKGDHFFNEKGEPYNSYAKEYWWSKFNYLILNDIKIMKFEEVKEYLRYVKDKYGKDYLKSFKIKRSSTTIPSGSTLK